MVSASILSKTYVKVLFPLSILLFSSSITYWWWNSTKHSEKAKLQSHFNFSAREVCFRVEQRFNAYEQVLRNAGGLFSSSVEVEPGEFHSYISSLKLRDNFPGIRAAGFVKLFRAGHLPAEINHIRQLGPKNFTIYPDTKMEEKAAAVLIEPSDSINRQILGFDMFSDNGRFSALEKARYTGNVIMTNQTGLLPEDSRNNLQGFILLMCVYKNAEGIKSDAQKKENTIGWMYSAFNLNEFIAGIVGAYSNELEIEVYDGDEISESNRLYDTDTLNINQNKYLDRKQLKLNVLGHNWLFLIKSLPAIEKNADFQKAHLVFILGNLMGLLLAIITWLLINGRQRAMQIAQQHETRYKSLLQQVNAAVILLDPGRRIVETNRGATELLGYSTNELLGMMYEQLFPDSLKENAVGKFDFVRLNGQLRIETEYIRKNNTVFPAEANYRLINSGEESFVLVFLYDISERKQSEAKLKESERKYRTIFENVQDIVYQTDIQGNIVEISPSVQKYSGYLPDDLIGKPAAMIYADPKDRDILLNILKKKGEVFDYELKLKKHDGAVRIASVSSHLIYDKDGRCLGLAGSLRDITERKNAEMQLAKYTEELKTLNATKDKFFSIISHDLRGPLSGFLGAAEMLADFGDTLSKDELKKLGKELLKSAQGQFRLLEDLLSWSKMESGRMPFKPGNLSSSEEIQIALNLLSATAANKKVKLQNRSQNDHVVYADPQMLQILLRNLISNAIKFSYPESEVVISTEKENGNSIIIIEDHGAGMSQKVKERLFRLDEHYSADGTRGEKGTGLGLILCLDIVRKHEGRICVESELEKGSSFKVILPGESYGK